MMIIQNGNFQNQKDIFICLLKLEDHVRVNFVGMKSIGIIDMLKEGDIIELKIGHKIYTKIPNHFIYAGGEGDWTLSKTEVVIKKPFDYLAGMYVVYKTCMEGGGTGHGPHDIYPDGHHVFCEKIDNENIKVDFYQSGCFTAMIKDIEPVGKAKKKWIV